MILFCCDSGLNLEEISTRKKIKKAGVCVGVYVVFFKQKQRKIYCSIAIDFKTKEFE